MKKNNQRVYGIVFLVMICLSLFLLVNHHSKARNDARTQYSDGIEMVDLNTIKLTGSNVEVHFSDVILSNQHESRKLIVSEQNATVYIDLTKRLFPSLDVSFMTKTQKVSYSGKGYFVVDLDTLTEDRIVDDKDKKILTIKIDHSHLQAVDINPNEVVIDDVKESLLARGDIEMTAVDFNNLEKELRTRLEEKFNTAENAQEADDIALKMVKEVYEPVVQAIDRRYIVNVEFYGS